MKNAILLHGTCDKEEYFSEKYPSLSNSHWFPWLQKELLINNISAQTPEVPEAFNPQYHIWEKEFERYDVGSQSILVGHSCGGGFMVRWLSENKINIEKLALVAPWLDPNRFQTKDFFDFVIDKDIVSRVKELHILISDNDEEDVLKSVHILNEKLPNAISHELKGKGHFTGIDKFPELLEILLK